MLSCVLKWAVRIPLDFLMAIVGRIIAPILPFFGAPGSARVIVW